MPTRRRKGAALSRTSLRRRVAGRQTPLDALQAHPGVRAWDRHVPMLEGPPPHWLDPVEAFVAATRPRNPDVTRAVALLMLDLAGGGWRSFADGTWVGRLPPHAYVHLDAPGVGDARALGLAARLVDWARAEGHVDDAAATRLHDAIASTRAAVFLD